MEESHLFGRLAVFSAVRIDTCWRSLLMTDPLIMALYYPLLSLCILCRHSTLFLLLLLHNTLCIPGERSASCFQI